MNKQKLAEELGEQLRDDILYRYGNEEYWDLDIIHDFQVENELTNEQIEEILKEV